MSTISATAKLNTVKVSMFTLLKAALNKALRSKAFATVCGIVLFGVIMWVMISLFTMLLNACVAVFGEALGLLVYILISSVLCVMAELFGRWVALRAIAAQLKQAATAAR